MTVFELALISAISRNPYQNGDEGVVGQLSDWFMQPIRVPDARLAMERLIGRGLLTPSDSGAICDCMPTEKGLDCATTLYGGCIRMLDRGLGLLNVRLLSNLFDGLGGKA